jgi:FkbM family methyltransferase
MKHYGFQLENEIFWRGLENGWEKVSVGIWIKLCRRASVVVDIGANTGIYSLIAKAVNPGVTVYAFEPVKRVFEKLQYNNKLNNYDIMLFEKAVSDSTGYATIYDQPTEHIYSVTVNKNLADANTPVLETKVETITLDTFIESHHIKHIDVVKIDVETHEPEVLRGFIKYLGLFRPAMLVEVLNDAVGRSVQQAVEGFGYVYFNIDEHGSIKKVDTMLKSDYYNFLICSERTADDLGIL